MFVNKIDLQILSFIKVFWALNSLWAGRISYPLFKETQGLPLSGKSDEALPVKQMRPYFCEQIFKN